MKRRNFVKVMAGAAAGPLAAGPVANSRKIITLQLDAHGFLEQGIERLLDNAQERACVNGLLLDAFWLSRGGSGHMGTVHPVYYRDTGIDPRALQPPSANGLDVLAALASPARQRRMTRTCIVKDILPDDLPGSGKLRESDFNGQRAETTCKNNPYYRRLLLGVVEDLIHSYDIDGIMYMAERQGAFTDTLGIRFRGIARGLSGSRTCFCEFCRAKGEKLGIRFDRVRTGFEELERFAQAGRSRQRPVDGYYVTLWRLMLRYPELLMWEHLWHESFRELLEILYKKVKSVRPSVQFGSHIWPNHMMSPIFRAEQDISELSKYNDFLKFPLYQNCGGPRIASYIESVSQTIWGDVPPDELLQFHYRVLGYEEDAYPEVRRTGLNRNFVYRECKRAMAGALGTNTLILPGIDVDIPIRKLDLNGTELADAAKCTRQSIKVAVKEAFRANVPGIIISREYTEMRPENLSGVGDAIRELGLNPSRV